MSRSALARMVPCSIGISYDLPVRLSTTLRESLPAALSVVAVRPVAESFVRVLPASLERGMGAVSRSSVYDSEDTSRWAARHRDQRSTGAATPLRNVLIRCLRSRGRDGPKTTGLPLTGGM